MHVSLILFRKIVWMRKTLWMRTWKDRCRKSIRYVKKERVIEPDFLANLAYNQRVSRNNETSIDGYNEPVGEITLSPGETWWNKVVNQRSNMPPLNCAPLSKPTKSECSSATSGFRSATPDIFSDAVEPSRSVTPLSVNTENSRSDATNAIPRVTEGSESGSKTLRSLVNIQSKIETRMTTRSKSNNVGERPKKKEAPASTIISRRKKMGKKKKITRSTSHGSDCFSTCAKCSRILSKAV
ncbi:uncharacterized protein [Venturia canescens]|uniref:uncharacterized protein n=1 Tax=Venturia canescens TaxID=32260 RepID=UPI001C9CBC9E|nr:uncharacterized protein LOC122407258 [Venturia canescens]